MNKNSYKVLKEINRSGLDNSDWDVYEVSSLSDFERLYNSSNSELIIDADRVLFPAKLLVIYTENRRDWTEYEPDMGGLYIYDKENKLFMDMLVWQLD